MVKRTDEQTNEATSEGTNGGMAFGTVDSSSGSHPNQATKKHATRDPWANVRPTDLDKMDVRLVLQDYCYDHFTRFGQSVLCPRL